MTTPARDTITIKVLLFGAAADAANYREKEFEVPTGTTAMGAFKAIVDRPPQLKALENSIRFAVNQEYAAGDEVLKSGDEIALIPPVSGG